MQKVCVEGGGLKKKGVGWGLVGVYHCKTDTVQRHHLKNGYPGYNGWGTLSVHLDGVLGFPRQKQATDVD